MKKVLYSVGLVTAMLFTACSSEDRTTSAEAVETNTTEGMDTETMNSENMNAGTANADITYQQNAQMVSDQLSRDLQLDDATTTEVTRIYEERYRQIGELEQGGTSFNETERMGGQTNETGNNAATSNTGTTNQTGSMNRSNADLTQIDETTDRELKGVLTPEQYRQYEQNRDKYNNMQFNNRTNGTGTTNSGVNGTTNRSNATGTNSGTGTGSTTGTGTDRPTGGNQ